MTKEQLKSIMKFQLTNFNDEGEIISDTIIHKKVLNEDDGFAHVNSAQLYKDVIRFVLVKQNIKVKAWPSDWLNLSVNELSNIIID